MQQRSPITHIHFSKYIRNMEFSRIDWDVTGLRYLIIVQSFYDVLKYLKLSIRKWVW